MIFAFTPFVKVTSKTKQKTNVRDTWAKQLAWVSQPVQNLSDAVIKTVKFTLHEVYHKPYLRWYAFYCRDTMKYDSFFAVMMLRKQYLRVRFCLPSSFKDKHGLLKKYKGWFFTKEGQQELGIRIDGRSTWSFEEQDHFKKYLKEAYDFAVERNKTKGA